MIRRHPFISLMLILTFSVIACNLPAAESGEPTLSSAEAAMTSVAETVSATLTQGAVGGIATSDTPESGEQTATKTATSTSTSTKTPSPTVTKLPCDRAKFISDVTVPDGTDFSPGENFTKTWRLKNDGSCTWNTGYKLVFDHGDQMDAPGSVSLTGDVQPGQTVNLSVNMTAPSGNGIYKGYWKLRNESGDKFGIGNNANVAFWVEIEVVAASFAVTSVQLDVDHHNIEGACPQTFNFQAQITTNGAGTVTYYWTRSDGAHGPTKTLNFTEAGTQTVTSSWSLGLTYSGWKKIYIEDPNHQLFGTVEFTLTCT